jgi:hypothetical protein
MANNTKIWLAQLKSGGELKVNQRDYLVIQQYAEEKGITLAIVKKEGIMLTVKAK